MFSYKGAMFMNDNETNFDEEILGEDNENQPEIQQEKNDIFSPITSRDVYSYSKDEEVPERVEDADVIIINKVNINEKRIYDLVVKRFLSVFMKEHIYMNVTRIKGITIHDQTLYSCIIYVEKYKNNPINVENNIADKVNSFDTISLFLPKTDEYKLPQ